MTASLTSQNGWPVVTGGLTGLPQVTGKVLTGPVWVVMFCLAYLFNAKVEPIHRSWSWGYSRRKIKGSTKWSNHASGTAVDFNAPRHPMGKRGTFTKAQAATIQLLLKAFLGVVRWGESYGDGMHFEIAPKVTPDRVEHLANVLLQTALAQVGVDPGEIDGVRGPLTVAALKDYQTRRHLVPDGIDGPKTWAQLAADGGLK